MNCFQEEMKKVRSFHSGKENYKLLSWVSKLLQCINHHIQSFPSSMTNYIYKKKNVKKIPLESEMCQSGKISWKWQSPSKTFWLPASTTTVMRFTLGTPKEETSAGNSRGKCLTFTSAASPFCHRILSLIFNSCLLPRAPPNIHTNKNTADSHFRIDVALSSLPTQTHKQRTRTFQQS